MAQEFTINSSAIEDKINKLLPSQGGFGAGIDFSASTMVIPIVDLTETAEGAEVRQDLQTALSLTSITAFDCTNTTSTIINTTGFWRVFGNGSANNTGSVDIKFKLTDGTTTKTIYDAGVTALISSAGAFPILQFDFVIKLEAGESLTAVTGASDLTLRGVFRQIADVNGNLIDP